jgi:hypothetical protein
MGTTTACGSRADSRLRGCQHQQDRRSGARTLVLRLGRGALAARLLVLDVLDALLLVLVDEELGAARALPEVRQPQLARVVRDERGPAQARAQVLCARARGGRVVRRLEERALERLERAEAGRRQCAGGHGGRWQEVWRTRLSSPPTLSTRCFSRARLPYTTCVHIYANWTMLPSPKAACSGSPFDCSCLSLELPLGRRWVAPEFGISIVLRKDRSDPGWPRTACAQRAPAIRTPHPRAVLPHTHFPPPARTDQNDRAYQRCG